MNRPPRSLVRLVCLIAIGMGAMPVHAQDSARVARVLAGLRGPVEIVGRPPVRWTIQERLANYSVPGVSFAIISGGRVVWAGGFGVKEAGGSDPVTSTTLFQAASISKPVAMTALLRLVHQGRLALDTDVNRYLKSWQVPDNRFTATEKVTLRRIASHSAGLTISGFPGYAATATVPSVVQVLNGQAPANTGPVRVDTTPGAIWRYAGGGTTVAQLVMTDVTGEPFPALMKRLVLEPARMTRSTYEQPLPEARRAEAARAHQANGALIPGGWHSYPEMAAAGLWTTPTELAQWALAIAAARAGTDTTLLPPALVAQMLTAQKGSTGIGPVVADAGRGFRFGHSGANAGFRSNLIYFPEAGVGLVIMTNSDRGGAVAQEVQNAVAAEFGWPALGPRRLPEVARDSAALAPYVGTWTLRSSGQPMMFVVAYAAGKLTFAPNGGPDTEELVPADLVGGFHTAVRGARFEFRRDSVTVLQNPGGPLLSGTRGR